MNTVIVGVDHSDKSKRALQFAIKEAALRGARLRIVRAWDIVPCPSRVYGRGSIAHDLESLEQDARRTVAQAVEYASRLEPNVQAEGKAVFGEARIFSSAKPRLRSRRKARCFWSGEGALRRSVAVGSAGPGRSAWKIRGRRCPVDTLPKVVTCKVKGTTACSAWLTSPR